MSKKEALDLPCSDNQDLWEKPWGTHQVINSGEGYKVKILSINPNQRISLQRHFYRSEKWTVLNGRITVTLNKQEFPLDTFDEIYIPKEAEHRISNHTDSISTILEIQIGDILQEDDIIRLEDDYSRLD